MILCILLFEILISVSVVLYLNSPPKEMIFSLIFFTTSLNILVPICGLASYKISSGAPHSTNVSNTFFILCSRSLIEVFNLPSENVPAPPSPN